MLSNLFAKAATNLTKSVLHLSRTIPINGVPNMHQGLRWATTTTTVPPSLDQLKKTFRQEVSLLTEEQQNQTKLDKLKRKKVLAQRKMATASGKPKKPLTARMRFNAEFWPKQPKYADNTERFKAGSEAWQKLSESEKQKYQRQYEKEKSEYEKNLHAWENQMMQEGHEKLLEQKVIDKLASESGKPKKPMMARLRFNSEFFAKHPTANNLERMKASSDAWKALSESEKQKYQTQYENEKSEYDKKLHAWEEKMMQEGRGNLLNKSAKDKLMIEHGMPKRPLVARIRFNTEFFKKSTFSDSTERFQAASDAWKALGEKEKKKYEDAYKTDHAKYVDELKLWEAKMIAEGRKDLLPKKNRH